ncbi:glycosyltransferase family 2 protein [Thalassobacillus pellis]|uniref:glycosyltransferase family 2 protein n=1 Tax=Thalassobacillus pellis TaxID=748008 RepID=UPI0019605D33|nr:glycosyltransferase [Thalassobacillus pellis]MBM7554171.1 cellulose synthase/poly-beta-1,6-N-acetylglucosamine synthase-like glycosyltransferase [Thalassobacillus pellis]
MKKAFIVILFAFTGLAVLSVIGWLTVDTIFLFTTGLFVSLLFYYSLLAVAGLYYRSKKTGSKTLKHYPRVDILIPAHNEAVVIEDTLNAMVGLEYPGELNIYVLNDNSTDGTADIVEQYVRTYRHLHHIQVPRGEPKGKSRVLNHGLSISNGELFCVYDADNQPEPQALRLLVETAMESENAAGAVGYVKTLNEKKNLLTRMISIEFQVFQLLMQSGRWQLFRTGSLTGTNMLVKRSVMEELGGYDPYAIAEDAELTLRITRQGFYLPIVPHSVTWEQEPETLPVYIKQRTRWLQGNLYIVEQTLRVPGYFRGKLKIHSIHQLMVYVVFWIFLILSSLWFILGVLGVFYVSYSVPLLFIWYVSYIIYTAQLMSAQAAERSFTSGNIAVSFIMYFTYAQMFSYLFVRSLWLYLKAKKNQQIIGWDKTSRFKQKI